MMTTCAGTIDAMQTMAVPTAETFLNEIKATIIDPLSNTTVTASDFKTLVKNELDHFKHAGLRAGRRVFLEARSDVQFLSRFIAVMELGGIAIPFDAKGTVAEQQRLVESSRPDYRYLAGSQQLEALSQASTEEYPLPDDVRLFLLTSGTTGTPKAVIHGVSNLKARIENGRRAIALEHRRSCLSVLPLHFGHGLIGVVLQALLDSEHLVLVPPDLGDPRLTSQIGKWIDAYGVTFVSGTPGTWSYITRMSSPPAAGSLRRVQMASAHATEGLQRKIREWASGADFFNCYGMTETATWVSDRLVGDGVEPHNVGSGRNWNSVFEILSPDENGVGEVAVTTSSQSYGYLRDWKGERQTKGRYLTGDWGRVNQQGELLLLGRRSRIINRGGLKVSPEEIEREIMSLGIVNDAVVFGASDLNDQRTSVDSIVGILVLAGGVAGETLDGPEMEKALTQGLLKTLSSHKIPNQWLVWDSIPRRPNGKPDMVAIKAKFRQKTP